MDHAPRIVNLAEAPLAPRPPEHQPTGPAAQRFDARLARLGPLVGCQQLGVSLMAVPPGKSAFPFHSHRANEELVVVLEGTGTLRLGAERLALKTGDVVALPAGGPQTAHQVINTGGGELRYLCVSTMVAPEVCEYPDSGKIAAYGPELYHMAVAAAPVDYWQGE